MNNASPAPEGPKSPGRTFLVALAILVLFLFFLGWSQASLKLSFLDPQSAQTTILLLALSAFVFVAFFIFGLILLRILIKLYVERRQEQLGSRFKTKMVVAFLAMSLVPVCFLFLFAYGLLNRSLDRWFGIPFDVLRQDVHQVSEELSVQAQQRALDDSAHLVVNPQLRQALLKHDFPAIENTMARQIKSMQLAAAVVFDSQGRVVARAGGQDPPLAEITKLFPALTSGQAWPEGETARWRAAPSDLFLSARAVEDDAGRRLGAVVSVRQLPLNVQQIADQIEREAERYDALGRERKAIKRADLSILWLVTLLILFSATWLAMFLSKQVTVPIQALAEGTQQVSEGNLAFQVSARADGELTTLIRSFNQMTLQLQESRHALERAAQDLQGANRALEERSNTLEAILESIPAGVISFNPQGEITRVNSTVERTFGRAEVKSARRLTDLFSAEDAREVAQMFRRAGRQGTVTRQMELDLNGRRSSLALTLSSIRARHGAVGWVLILDDLTDLLRAQKSAAWQEVARRLAHEIKNPLTPIQLSTERIRRLIDRAGPGDVSPALVETIAESASLVSGEVATLKALVDEFSAFARFPVSQPVPSSLNAIVEDALNVFDGRLAGIHVHRELAGDLPLVQADPAQMKRVVVNLVDNAAEALEHSPLREIRIRTTLDAERDVVELEVADSGPGISPDAREKLFLPTFSTKGRGTGLGLAIVSRIVSEHHGWIRVEENRPSGAKFTIELPLDSTAVDAAP
ncbi:MAG TPA: ATP-binding protein [Terriglobia bacterium]|nr:ATP-binding protein [Terriglobia bacterium]